MLIRAALIRQGDFMNRFDLITVATRTFIGLCTITAQGYGQHSVVRWSVFDTGFASSESQTTNSRVQSAIGQQFVGLTGTAINRIDSGFLVDGRLRGATTAIGESGGTESQLTYELSQNYPNPFNPTTRIRFTIPDRIHVSLQVFNVLGQEVVSLVNEEKAPGVYDVKFDAKNLSSGAYFYLLRAGAYVQLKKLLILK